MAEKTCDGNCLGCSFQQQAYCAAQRTYALLKNQEATHSRLSNMEEALEAMKAAFERFIHGTQIINPFEKPETGEGMNGAQNGGGAENRPLGL